MRQVAEVNPAASIVHFKGCFTQNIEPDHGVDMDRKRSIKHRQILDQHRTMKLPQRSEFDARRPRMKRPHFALVEDYVDGFRHSFHVEPARNARIYKCCACAGIEQEMKPLQRTD